MDKNYKMKNLLGTIIAFLFAATSFAQITISGAVVDKQNKQLSNATVILRSGLKEKTTLTNNVGVFQFNNVSPNENYKLIVQYVGMRTYEGNFSAIENRTFNIVLETLDYFLEPLEIKAVRASDKAPFTKTDITKLQLDKINLGQDIPILLNQTPSVVVNSDAGNGVGYTYIHIRGTDASRINVTLNGIPYNDAESQGTYFVDLPDFTSSVNSIQIQRGVGTSTNGSGAFGATLNFSTNEINRKAYAEFNNSFGSFNTWKNTLKAGSGLIGDHFTADIRLSNITSDGYIDRATSRLRSLYFSTAYLDNSNALRFNIIKGYEKTYQAWYGVSEADLKAGNRTINYAGTEKPGEPYDNETDNYWQDHYQLFYTHHFNSHLDFNTALFFTKGKGYYEEYRAGQSYDAYHLPYPVVGTDTIYTSDFIRQLWLNNNFYGDIFSLQYHNARTEFTAGGAYTRYEGDHYGKLIWAEHGITGPDIYYDHDAFKNDLNSYAKLLQKFSKNWNAYIDLQYRHVNYNINGFEENPS